jgi:alpha-L-glutamate ligase-like protein
VAPAGVIAARAPSWWQRLRWLRRNALGLNRRNQDLLLRRNPPRLVALVDHKGRTKEVLAQRGVAVPQTYLWCRRTADLPAVGEALGRLHDFVLKPARGAGGEGVVVIAGRQGEQLVRVSGATVSPRDLLAHAADILGGAFSLSQTHDDVLLEERLLGDEALAPFCPQGVADLRVLVVSGVPLLAMVRLPTRASEGRANLHVGGIGVGLDLATGQARHAICRDRAIERHPDTAQPLCAVRIPMWPAALALAARAHDAVPLGYLGVDIVLDARHGPVILELNARPGLSIQLANRCGLRPLLGALVPHQERLQEMNVEQRVALGIEMNRAVGEP